MVGRDKVKTIYLFRHGETDLNKNRIIQGSDIDSSLNENGISQAKELAEKLADSGIEHIYSSPLTRAFSTAEFVAKKLNISIEKMTDLREISFGKFSSMSIVDIDKELGENFYKNFSKTTNYDDFIFKGGESKAMVRSRFVNCIKNILIDTKYSTIGVASHGIALKQFCYAVTSEYPKSIPNCCIIRCIYDGEIRNLEMI